MTHTFLIEGIAAELRSALAKVKMPTEYMEKAAEENFTQINVFEQYIPTDLFEETNYFPCAIVEWLDTTDKMSGQEIKSKARIGLSIGVFAKEADGYKDAFHLMEICRERLLSKRIIANRFRLSDEVTWETAQSQPAPFFFVYAELEYNIYQIQEPFETLTDDGKWKDY